jgi:predicted DNA-binding protein (MmcQ/YjbR family)
MNEKQFNAFCKKLPATTYVKQWGESHVWKVGGKVFAIGGWEDSDEDEFAISFKVSDMNFEILQDRPGLRGAPYLASRGLKWIQHYGKPGLSDDGLKDCIKRSYEMIARALSKKETVGARH